KRSPPERSARSPPRQAGVLPMARSGPWQAISARRLASWRCRRAMWSMEPPAWVNSPHTRRSASWSAPVDDALRALAHDAGIAVDWVDAADRPQRVAVGALRRILDALGYPNASRDDIAESRKRLRDLADGARDFYTATVGAPIAIGAAQLRPIDTPGYHRLDVGGRDVTV